MESTLFVRRVGRRRAGRRTNKHTNKQSTLRRRRLPLPNALRNEISRSGALTLIYIYIYERSDYCKCLEIALRGFASMKFCGVYVFSLQALRS